MILEHVQRTLASQSQSWTTVDQMMTREHKPVNNTVLANQINALTLKKAELDSPWHQTMCIGTYINVNTVIKDCFSELVLWCQLDNIIFERPQYSCHANPERGTIFAVKIDKIIHSWKEFVQDWQILKNQIESERNLNFILSEAK